MYLRASFSATSGLELYKRISTPAPLAPFSGRRLGKGLLWYVVSAWSWNIWFSYFAMAKSSVCWKSSILNIVLKKKWRDSDFEGDIFWDYVRTVEKVEVEEDVYDVVLPESPKNEHMFVANGFIVHNSAGMSLPAYRVIIKSLKR